jgi:uncharacterized membrane protein
MNFVKYVGNLPLSKKVFYLVMLVFGGIYYTTVIANHYYFRTYAFDYAVYNFVFWDYAHFHISVVPCNQVWGHMQRIQLQDHFSFILMYLVPFYWLLNWLTGSYTLLILQTTLIMVSAWAIYRLIKLKTNDDWLAVLSVLFYFLLQGRYASFSSDCNISILACSLVPVFLLLFELRKYTASFILLVLLLFSREDMPLWFVFIFIVFAIWHRKERKILAYCLAGMVTSIVYFILLFKVFIPLVETPNMQYGLFQYSALGGTPLEALFHIFKHPVDTFKLLYKNPLPDHTFDHVKTEFYWVYLISGGFLLFLRPQYFIWFIPIIAQKMFNDEQIRWGIVGYYGITVVTIFPVSIFMIISIFKQKWIRYSVSIIVCVLALYVTWYKSNILNRSVIWGNTVKENIFDPAFFHPGYDPAKIHNELKLIPSGSKICASESILPHLAQRRYPYSYPDIEDAYYLALFTFRDFYQMDDNSYRNELYKYVFSPSWESVAYNPPLIILKKVPTGAKRNNMPDSLECNALNLSQDKQHFVASDGELIDNGDTRDSSMKRNGNSCIRLNKDKPYGFTYHGIHFTPGDMLAITVWKFPAYKDTVKLTASCGKDFYQYASSGKDTDKSGWEKLELNVTVPENDSNFTIYVVNETRTNVWFNDLKIVRFSGK